MTNSNSTDRNTARKLANFIASDAPHNLTQGIPGWDCVDSPLHGNRDAERLDAPARYDCYFVKTEMDGSPVQSTLADLEASLAGDENASIDTKVLKVVVLHWDRQLPGCWRTFELLTLKDAIDEIKRTGRHSIVGRIGLWPNGSDKARSYVGNVIYEQTNPEGYAEMLTKLAPTPEYSSAERLADARVAESTDNPWLPTYEVGEPKKPACAHCKGKLTKLDIQGSWDELGYDEDAAICGACYETHYLY